MSQKELIELFKRGGRIPRQPCSLHDSQIFTICHHGWWRPIVCDGENDVLECSKCGAQKLATCDFDDDND